MPKIKKNLSLDEDIISKGMIRAKEMFGGNFSSYISFLIYQDTKGVKLEEVRQEIKQEEKVIEKHDKDLETLKELDSILEM